MHAIALRRRRHVTLRLSLVVATVAVCTTGSAADAPREQYDVIVVGGTPGGIAAAVSAARMNRSVALVAPEDHIGGIISNGLTNSDISNKQAVGGLFYTFTRRVRSHYEMLSVLPHWGDQVENLRRCQDGYWYEPQVAEQVFTNMLQGQSVPVQLLLRHELTEATVRDGRIEALALRDAEGREVRLRGQVFIDGTYEGDLAGAAKAPYRVGREARSEYDEPHAGFIYTTFGTTEPLPGSTGEADQAIQGFCFRFHMTTTEANRVPVEKPAGFDRNDYRAVLADIATDRVTKLKQVLQFYPMPGDRFELNSDHPHPDTGVPSESLDLAEENWTWPEASPAERKRIYARYVAYDVGLVWLLQHDPEVPSAIRDEAQRYGWCRDLWPNNSHLPRQVYVRQGRRIVGEYVLTERDGNLDAKLDRTRVQPTSIAIAEYAFDSHGCHKYDPAHPGVREGYIYVRHKPLQIPYGVIVAKGVDNLLVPVGCSASHVGYQAIRMEPVFMALGEAAGAAAHLAIELKQPVRSIPTDRLQLDLIARGAVIAHLDDVPFSHPALAALQWLGARGFNRGYLAEPDKLLSRKEAAERLARVFAVTGTNWPPPPDADDQPLLGKDLVRWFDAAGLNDGSLVGPAFLDRQRPVEALAQATFKALTAPKSAP